MGVGSGEGACPSPVNYIYFNWYIFGVSLFLHIWRVTCVIIHCTHCFMGLVDCTRNFPERFAILLFSVNFTGTTLLNR